MKYFTTNRSSLPFGAFTRGFAIAYLRSISKNGPIGYCNRQLGAYDFVYRLCAKQPYPKEQKRNETGDFIKVPWWDEPADTDTIEK